MRCFSPDTAMIVSSACPPPENQQHITTIIYEKSKTYNSRDSHVVTHHTTNRPACGLSTAERTGSPVLHTLWSYVLG